MSTKTPGPITSRTRYPDRADSKLPRTGHPEHRPTPAGQRCLTTDRTEWNVALQASIDLPGLRRELRRHRRACTARILESRQHRDQVPRRHRDQVLQLADRRGGIHAEDNHQPVQLFHEGDAEESLITDH